MGWRERSIREERVRFSWCLVGLAWWLFLHTQKGNLGSKPGGKEQHEMRD